MFQKIESLHFKRKRELENNSLSNESESENESDTVKSRPEKKRKKSQKEEKEREKNKKERQEREEKKKQKKEKPKENNTIEITIPNSSKLKQLNSTTLEIILQLAVSLAESAYFQAQENSSVAVEALKRQLAQEQLKTIQVETKAKEQEQVIRKTAIEETTTAMKVLLQEQLNSEADRMTHLVKVVEDASIVARQAKDASFEAFEHGRQTGLKESENKMCIVDKLDVLTKQFSNLTGSKGAATDKGKFGENLVEKWLETWFAKSGAEITNVSTVAHAGDCIIQFPHPKGYTGTLTPFTVLLEIKYKAKILSSDVIKYHSDVDLNSKIHAALFVSIKSKAIPGHKDLHYTFRNEKIVGYVGNDEADANGRDVRSSILLMRAMYYESGAKKQGNTSDELFWSKLRMQIEVNLRSLKPNLKRLTTDLKTLKKTVNSLQTLDLELNNIVSWLENTFNKGSC